MRQDSETNIMVLNTALKYEIQRKTQKHKYIQSINQSFICIRPMVHIKEEKKK